MALIAFIRDTSSVLAQQDANTVFESLRRGFSGPSFGPVVFGFLVAFAILLGIIATLFVIRHRQESRGSRHSPKALFLELSTAHNLSVEERKLLRDLAKSGQSNRPDRIFMRSDLFERATLLPRFSDATTQGRIESLRRRLFGSAK